MTEYIVLKNLQIAYCPAYGVNVVTSNGISIEKSIVFGNTWWSTQGASAISIEDAYGDVQVIENVVYGNRNYIPFFKQENHSIVSNKADRTYGTFAQFDIQGGNGISASRLKGNLNSIAANLIYDNGLNGILVHNST